jgi:hypothetical protein
MVSKITKEEMQRLSERKTEEELIKLGTSLAEDKFESKIEDIMIRDKEVEINRLRNELSNVTKKQILEIFSSYILLQKKKSERRDKEFKKLKCEYDDLNEENKSNIIELDQLEKEKDARILKLRTKCREKNRKNKMLSISIFISSVLSFYIGYLGFFTLVNNIFSGCSHIFSYSCGAIYYIFNMLCIMYHTIRNNHYYAQYIIIGVVLFYKFNRIKMKMS